MKTREFVAGETLYAPGEAPEHAFLVRSGEVHLWTTEADGAVSERTISRGEIFGLGRLVTGGAREETAQVALDARLVLIDRAWLLEVLDAPEGPLAGMIRALVDTVQRAERVSLRDAAQMRAPVKLWLRPAGKRVAAQIGEDGLVIRTLPFRVGRRREGVPSTDGALVDLSLTDAKPYHLSRRHFTLSWNGDSAVVVDETSYHGTVVNGTRIGIGSESSIAVLHEGDNYVYAGRHSSPFRFVLTVGD